MTNLYIAYGSNLNVRQMAHRCPAARIVGTTEIRDTRLVFRGVADVVRQEGMTVPVGVWKITAACEAALDRYEGVGSGMYRKEYVTFDDGERALLYVMNSKGIYAPSSFYLDAIREGYRDFGLDEAPLREAVAHAKSNARMTHDMIERKLRNDARARKEAAEKKRKSA
jgi:gamma-glutamylcyclotransferase (GGCT)/AIG2-like uncharacterized protein YtfP